MIKDLKKLPKRKVTVDELIGRDDAVKRAGEAHDVILNSNAALIISLNNEGMWDWMSFNFNHADIIYYIEHIKNDILNGEDDAEDCD